MNSTLLLGLLAVSLATLAAASSPSGELSADSAAALALALEEQSFDRRMAEMDVGMAPGPEKETPIAPEHELPYHSRALNLDSAAALRAGWEAAREQRVAQDDDMPFDDASYYAMAARHIYPGMTEKEKCLHLMAAAIRRSPRNFERALVPLLAHRTWAACLREAIDHAVQHGAYKNMEIMLQKRPAFAKEILPRAYKHGRVAIMRLVLQQYKKPFYALYEAIRNAYTANRGSTFETLIKRCSPAQLTAVLDHARHAGRAYLFSTIVLLLTEGQIKSYFDSIWQFGDDLDIFVAILDAEHKEKYWKNGKGRAGRLVYGLEMPSVCDGLIKRFYGDLRSLPAPAPASVPMDVVREQRPVVKQGVVAEKAGRMQPVSVFEDDEDDAMLPLGGAGSVSMSPTLAPIAGQSGGSPVQKDVVMSMDVVMSKENIDPIGDEQQNGFHGKIVAKGARGKMGSHSSRTKLSKLAVKSVSMLEQDGY